MALIRALARPSPNFTQAFFRPSNTISRCIHTMRTQSIYTDKAPKPLAPYSQAIKAGDYIYLSGQIPLTADGKLVQGHEDIQVSTRQVLDNISEVLKAAGSEWNKLIKINIFITDMSKFGKVNEIYSEYFKDHQPARSCVAVSTLPMNVEIEIEAVALA